MRTRRFKHILFRYKSHIAVLIITFLLLTALLMILTSKPVELDFNYQVF